MRKFLAENLPCPPAKNKQDFSKLAFNNWFLCSGGMVIVPNDFARLEFPRVRHRGMDLENVRLLTHGAMTRSGMDEA